MSDEAVACLIKIHDGNSTRVHIITRAQFVIGRSAQCDLSLPSTTVSRKHLSVTVTKDAISITDLSSNNGTFVDGHRLQSHKLLALAPTSRIRLGVSKEEITFQYIPTPMELMDSETQRRALAQNMSAIKTEVEQAGRATLEEERKAMLARFKVEQEEARHQLEKDLNGRKQTLESQGRELLEGAKRKSDEIIAKAQLQADSYTAQTLKALLDKKQSLEEKIQVLKEEANKIYERTRSETSEQAHSLLSQTKAQASAEIQNALKSSEEILTNADQTAEEKLRFANREASMVIERATQASEKLKKDCEFDLKAKIEEAQARCDKIINDAKSKASQILEESKRSSVDVIRNATLAEQESILKGYRGAIERLHTSKLALEHQQKQLTDDIEDLKSDKNDLIENIDKFKESYIEEKRLLMEVQEELEQAQKNIAKSEIAIEELKQSKATRDTVEKECIDLRGQLESQKMHFDVELKNHQEQITLELEEKKKRSHEELASLKLAALERVRADIQEEERRYVQSLNLKAAQLSRSIEKNLIPSLELHFRSKGVSVSLGSVFDHIDEAVKGALMSERLSFSALTEHLGLHPLDDKKRRTIHRSMIYGTSLVILFVTMFFGRSMVDYFRSQKSQYGEHLVSKRTAESIYTPLQSDEWRETYTGNVLYLRNYSAAKVDTGYETQWPIKLNGLEFLREAGLSEDDVVRFVGKESTLIRELLQLRENIDNKYLDEGLEKMNSLEKQVIEQMKTILKTEENYANFRALEKDFTQQFIRKKYSKGQIRAPANK